MRARLMAYSRGMPDAKVLRQQLQTVAALSDVDAIAENHLARFRTFENVLQEEPAALL